MRRVMAVLGIGLWPLVLGPPSVSAQGLVGDSAEVRTMGFATRNVRPNRATVTLRFSVIDSTPSQAGAALALRADSVRRALIPLGIPRDSMVTGSRWSWWNGRMAIVNGPIRCRQTAPNGNCFLRAPDTLYRASEAIEVHIANLESIGAVIDAALALGITDLSPIQFRVTDTRDVEREVLREATLSARAQAELIATTSGSRLGRILSLSTSGNDPVPYRGFREAIVMASASTVGNPGTQITAPMIAVSATVYGRWRLLPQP